MAIIDGMIREYEHEGAQTRKVLERVPEAHFGWKPHDKSMTLRELASHLSDIPSWVRPTIKQDEFAFSMKDFVPFKAETTKQLLEHYDKNLSDALDAMPGTTDPDMMKTWKMTMDGQLIIEMPRVAVLRGMMMNHAIHHRAQLGVYLRLLDVPLPQLYGPTADEQ
jgi:uncharacterized damage-inducible protein DinB